MTTKAKEKTENKTVTESQIKEWREKYNGYIMKLSTDDDRVFWLFDPFFDFKILKMLIKMAGKSSDSVLAQSILSNCWLGGDESILTDPRALLGMEKAMTDLLDMPICEVERDEKGIFYHLTCEGRTVKVRAAKREDVIEAENRNPNDEMFKTSRLLLDKIKVSDITEIKANNRIYVGICAGIDKVKDRVHIRVEKLWAMPGRTS